MCRFIMTSFVNSVFMINLLLISYLFTYFLSLIYYQLMILLYYAILLCVIDNNRITHT